MQRQLWASQRRTPSSPHQNTALLSTIAGPIDPDRLAAAFASVAAASDVLRTRIHGEAASIDPDPVVTEQLVMRRRETSEWARRRAAEPLDMTTGGIDSVIISHPDGTSSWYLNLHHVITDATASAAVFETTARVYGGEPMEVPSYYRWAAELDAAEDRRTERSRAYWDDREPMPRAARLYEPVDDPSPLSTRSTVALPAADLSSRLAADYASLSEDLAWTGFLTTAAALYLHRVTGMTEMSIGLPVHNRSTPESAHIFGPVMQVYPVAVRIEPHDTHRSLHKRVTKAAMATIRNARPGVSPSLSDVEAVVNIIPRAGISSFGDFAVSTEWVHPGATDPSHLFQLQLSTYANTTPQLIIDVNSAAAGGDPARPSTHLESIIRAMIDDPDASIGSQPIVSSAETLQLRSWVDRYDEAPEVPLAIERLERSLLKSSITDGPVTVTGAELVRRIASVAGWLQTSHGVRAGDRVAVQMSRSADAVVTFLACWWLGVSFVPIDPCQPELRRRSLIERAGCRTTLTDLPEDCDDPIDRVPVSDSDEAYLLFTSGSTGEPKGVPITHRGVSDYLHFATTHYLAEGETPVVPLFSALTFDLTVTSIFLPLLCGGELVVIRKDGVPGLKQIASTPSLTWMKATPSHLELLLRLVPNEHAMNTIVIGGEALSARLTRDLWSWRQDARLFNEYGPTEAVVGCMIYEAQPDDRFAEVPIGRPAPGVELRVVDAYDGMVPAGVPGELLISSRGVTTGYLGAEPGTGPFVHLDGRRFYRSGDLVRFVAPGVLTYLGRADEQIKVGGIRLDPTEVEFQLEQHPAVQRAAVRLAENVTLAAWFESTADEPPSPLALRTWVADRVPAHAVPIAYVSVDELPTSANGKLDARQLPAPSELHRVNAGATGRVTELEALILRTWMEQLDLSSIGVEDDFFDLGADSLAGMQSVERIGIRLGRDLPEELIFANRTARLLAAAIEADGGLTASVAAPGDSDDLALSPGEQAMLFAWMNDPDGTENNVGRSYRIDGSLDPDRLFEAALALVQRHRPLHLSFSTPRRTLEPDRALTYTSDSAEVTLEEFEADAMGRFLGSFDLEDGPLLRIHRQSLTDGSTGLLIALHHALIDESGLDRLFGDLGDLYAGTELAELSGRYESFTDRQLQRSGQQQDRAFWLAQPDASSFDFGAASAEPDGYLERQAGFSSDRLEHESGVSGAAYSLAAAARALAPFSRSSMIQIGMPISVRSSRDHELCGYALNMLPMTVNSDDAIASATAMLGQALVHRNYPFASIVADRRAAQRPTPPLSALLAFGRLADVSFGGLPARHRVLAPDAATTDITFFVQVRGTEVNLGLEYAGDTLSSHAAADLLQRFENELAGIAAAPHDSTDGWTTGPALEEIPDQPLDEIVAEIAGHDPYAIAVSAGEQSISYRDLLRRANALAHQLHVSGVIPGSFVGVIAGRSPDVVPAILGILRAGCAYVPIDPEYPADRIATIIDDSGIVALVTPDGPSPIDRADVQTIVPATATMGAFPPNLTRSPTDIAYAIFTSGSTGRPKGVSVSHANIVYSTMVRPQVYRHQPDAFLLLSSFAFDSSMVGLWWTLCAGGTIVLPDPGLHTDVDHLGELVTNHRVSHLLAIPSLYAVLLGEVGAGPLDSLNTVMVAGEACPANLVQAHYRQLEATELHNEYGPTEASVWSHHHRFDPDHDASAPVPIGRSLPGSKCVVVKANLQPVEVEEVGELLLGGPGVTPGYLGQPELTAERFPLWRGERTYRTGDLVRLLADGALEFIGRVDDQVKIRGVRIELAEIEAAALVEDGIRSAAAATYDTPNGTRLGLWYVPSSPSSVDEDALRTRLTAALPPAMVPTRLVELDTMPVTPNGKIDRNALTDSKTTPPEPNDRPSSAETESGEAADVIRSLWSEVLGIDTVGDHDNFFDLGGDSILSIRIVSGLRRQGIRIKPRDLFDYPTVAELVTAATFDTRTEASPRFVGEAPLLPMQDWFFDQDFASPNHWNQSMWVESSERLDVARLERALHSVIDHHDALRARFEPGPSGWVQTIPETTPLTRVVELGPLSDGAKAEVATSVEQNLDITAGRLVGAALIHGHESDEVFLTVHHLAMDGVSWRPFLEDLTAAYGSNPLPPRTTSTATFAASLAALEPNPWWERLRDQLPEPTSVRYLETAGQQKSVSVRLGSSENVMERLLSAIGRAHRDVMGHERLTATLEGHGRADEIDDHLDLSRTVGWFTGMYPIDTPVEDFELEEAPLGGVGAMAVIERMPRLVINYLGQVDRSIAGTALLRPVSGILAGYGPQNHRTHDLGIMAHVTGGQLVVTWDYVAEEHDHDLIDRIIESFSAHFNTGAGLPRTDLVDLSPSDLAVLEGLFST